MTLARDLEIIVETVLWRDPAFRRVDKAALSRCLDAAGHCALEGRTEAFLLSAMRLLALAENGHTRLIPNDAIAVHPLRLVSFGAAIHLVGTAPGVSAPRGAVIAVNGRPTARIEAAASDILAGTRQRKRVIGAMLLAWPYALASLGCSSADDTNVYRVQREDGQITDFEVSHTHTVPASSLYPKNEHGRVDPAWAPNSFAEIRDWPGLGLSILLPSFFDPSGDALQAAIARAADQVNATPKTSLVIDVRGNTGGDFLKTLPLIDAIAETESPRVLVLVDKFTFSAAIVFVAILKHRLGGRLRLIGEEVGDALRFFAEGGSLQLPVSGAVIRYSSAFHDWETGTRDETTPAEIARQLVPAGALDMDWTWTANPMTQSTDGAVYRDVLMEFSG